MTKFNDDDPIPILNDRMNEEDMTKTGKSDKKDASFKKKKKRNTLDAMQIGLMKEISEEKRRIISYIKPYVLSDPKWLDIIDINDEFWLEPEFTYKPSDNLMKKLILIGYTTESVEDLSF